MTPVRTVVTALVLSALATPALAQPGVTPPADAPAAPVASPPPPEAPQPSAQLPVLDPNASIDELLERVQAASPTLGQVARGAFRRARRAIAIGPTVGVWGSYLPAQSEGESAITFGLGLEKFDVPVMPTMQTLKALVVERTKAKLKEQIIARLKGQPADPLTLENLAREVWEEAVKEILGLEAVRNRHFERPEWSLGFEVNHMFASTAWAPRLRIGKGAGRVTFAGTVAWGLGADGYDKVPIYLGAEVVGHYLTSKSPRSPVIDLFLRVEFETRNRDTNTDQLQIGVRLLLDVI